MPNGTDPTPGAMPGAGAMPGQAGQQPPPPPPAGATPPAGTPPTAGATPPAGTSEGSGTTPPATGEEALGDAGKKALQDEREARKQAETRATKAEEELEELRKAGQTEQERALDEARKTATSERDAKWTAIVRRSKVESALTAAGITASELDLAANAPEFAELELTDQGEIEDLDKTVDAFKKSHPGLFGAPTTSGHQGGPWGGSEGGGGKSEATSLEGAIDNHYAKR